MATLSRRSLLTTAPTVFLAACEPKMPTTTSTTPKLDIDGLDHDLAKIAAAAAPGALGVGLGNLESGETYTFNGERRFPMQSVFKMLVGAGVLSEADAGRLPLAEVFNLSEQDLSPPYSPIGAAWPAQRTYTAEQLMSALLVDSDSTAADVLMKRIGGPGALTAWLAAKHVPDVRVDRYEREIQPEANGMPPFRPAWRAEAAFVRAEQTVPPAKRLAALRAYMADSRDTATPAGMLEFLKQLDSEELISPVSSRKLLRLMSQTRRGANRIRAGLPRDAFLAHRPGTWSGPGFSTAHNDVGIFTLADRRAYALAVFISGSTLEEAGRDRIIADVARAAVRAVG